MLDYQEQDSKQTLSEGITEFFAANKQHVKTRVLTPEADEFFRCHDASHVVFGCDISLNSERCLTGKHNERSVRFNHNVVT